MNKVDNHTVKIQIWQELCVWEGGTVCTSEMCFESLLENVFKTS